MHLRNVHGVEDSRDPVDPYIHSDPGPRSYSADRGFWETLFDFSFTFFLTTSIIRWLYVLALVVISLLTVVLLKYAVDSGSTIVFLAAPVFWVFAAVYARVFLEFLIVVFRIAEHVADIAQIERASQRDRTPS